MIKDTLTAQKNVLKHELKMGKWSKNKIYAAIVFVIHVVLWFYLAWWIVLISFILIYFGLGTILMTYVWEEE